MESPSLSSSLRSIRAQAKQILESPTPTSLETLLSESIPSKQSKEIIGLCLKHFVNAFSLKLSHLLLSSTALPATQARSAILLNHLISQHKCKPWFKIHSINQRILKSALISFLQEQHHRKELNDAFQPIFSLIGDVAYADVQEWPELVHFVLNSISSRSASLQRVALSVFTELPQRMDLIFRDHLGSIIDSFLQCLASPSMDVRASALHACVLLLERFFDSFDCDLFEEVLPGIMKAILGMLSCGHECLARGALTHLIALVTVKPEVFRPFIDDVVYSLLKIAECELLEEETKYAGVELLSTLAESVDEDNSMITNLPKHYKSRLISVLMTMLQCIEDDPTWYNLDDSHGAGAGKTKYFFLGTEFLDTVSTALGGHMVLPIVFEISIPYLQALSWKRRYAGIQAFIAVSEGCFGASHRILQVMVSCLEQVTAILLAVFRDPHPRVRWAAIDSVIRLVQDIGAEYLAGYCTGFLPALAAALEDFDYPRVQEHAASLIQTLSEHCGQDALHPCLELIVRKLHRLLQSGKHLLQVKALVCLASVVSSSQDGFCKCYSIVMPDLKAILSDKSMCTLHAKTVECIGLIARAVGKEKFNDDAVQVMEFLISHHQTHLEIDKSVESHISQAWVRLRMCLGLDFLPYLKVMMPTLIQIAAIKASSIQAGFGDITESVRNSIVNILAGEEADSSMNIILEIEKVRTLLSCFGSGPNECYYPWVEQVSKAVVPLLNVCTGDVRVAVSSVMPALLSSAITPVKEKYVKGRYESYIQKLLSYVLSALLRALHEEKNLEFCVDFLISLSECIESSESVLGTSQLKLIVDELKQVLIAYSTRKEEMEEKGKQDHHQATEQQSHQMQKIQHEEILNQVSDCLGALIRIFEANFLPCFDELLFYIVALLGGDNTVRERDIALSVFYEVVQHCQDAAQKYCDICLSFVFKACTDENAYIRKEGCFGIKVFAEYGGLSFKCFVGDAISCLDAVIGCTDTSELDDARARDMAITALGKICEFHPEKLDRAQVVHTWLGYLPLKQDMAAAQIAHEQLCSMVEKADKDLFGPHNINLPKIIVVFSQVLTEAGGLASPRTAVRIKDLLKKLMKILPRTLSCQPATGFC